MDFDPFSPFSSSSRPLDLHFLLPGSWSSTSPPAVSGSSPIVHCTASWLAAGASSPGHNSHGPDKNDECRRNNLTAISSRQLFNREKKPLAVACMPITFTAGGGPRTLCSPLLFVCLFEPKGEDEAAAADGAGILLKNFIIIANYRRHRGSRGSLLRIPFSEKLEAGEDSRLSRSLQLIASFSVLFPGHPPPGGTTLASYLFCLLALKIITERISAGLLDLNEGELSTRGPFFHTGGWQTRGRLGTTR